MSSGAYATSVKPVIDRGVALLVVLALAPLFALVALAVRLGSAGPVFYRQRRVGRDERPFDILKFRTMTVDPARVVTQTHGHSPGVTGVGRVLRRLKIDEMPQLLNVLAGDMSLVGPRPCMPELLERIEPWARVRFTVAPGAHRARPDQRQRAPRLARALALGRPLRRDALARHGPGDPVAHAPGARVRRGALPAPAAAAMTAPPEPSPKSPPESTPESTPESLRVLHLIPNLRSGGGAQAVLYRLIVANPANEHIVVTLLEKGTFATDLEARGIAVRSLELAGAADVPRALGALWRELRERRPDVVQTWMYHADLLGGVVARLAGVPVVWGLHHTSFEKGGTSRSVRLAARLCAALSHVVPRRIISCSAAGVPAHEAKGLRAGAARRRPQRLRHRGVHAAPARRGRPAARRARARAGGPPARHGRPLRPAEGPRQPARGTRAAARETPRRLALPALRLAHGCRQRRARAPARRARAARAGDPARTAREDVVEVMRSLDVHVLSSRFGEAFPNVLNESMLVGTPCVSTRVGDSALIVGESGWTVPPSDPAALAEAIDEALAAMADGRAWQARRAACRARIVERFGVATMAAGYAAGVARRTETAERGAAVAGVPPPASARSGPRHGPGARYGGESIGRYRAGVSPRRGRERYRPPRPSGVHDRSKV